MRVCHLNTDAAGVIDPAQWSIFQAALPATSRVVLWVHGWMQSAESSNDLAAAMAEGLAPRFPDDSTLFVALHWPSKDAWAELSYFVMERRARLIGCTAGFSIVREAVECAEGVELICVGHSFGAIVAAATLERVSDFSIRSPQYIAIQGALPNNVLESGQWGGPIQRIYPRVKVTTSQTDEALKLWFPVAEHLEGRAGCNAMGCAGPSTATITAYKDRLTEVDLTAAQAKYPMDPFSGHHSTIFIDPVFDLISSK